MESVKMLLMTIAVAWLAVTAHASEPLLRVDAAGVLEASIAYHDPGGVWDTARVQLGVHTVYSEAFAAKRKRPLEAELVLVLSPGHEEFRYMKAAGDDRVEISLVRGEGSVSVNGSTDVPDVEKERLGLAEPELYRDYCEYLYLMPMKLRDPGTHIDSHANRASFNGREVWQVKVTYSPEVGEHTWYFYFDVETSALVGYRFYKDEAKNDGEYITFEGEVVDKGSGLRLPKVRAWYYNADDGHLATDDITSIRLLPTEE